MERWSNEAACCASPLLHSSNTPFFPIIRVHLRPSVVGSRRMNHSFRLAILLSFIAMTPVPAARSQTKNASADTMSAAQLQAVIDAAVHKTLSKFADQQLKPDQLAVTLVDLRDPQHPVRASYRGNAQIYPASVVKLFYLAAVHRW